MLLLAALCLAAATPPARAATYVVELERLAPPSFSVTATWPEGSRLDMDTTRPGDLDELLEHGWPALVTGLRVTDATGRELELAPDGAAGWRLPADARGPLRAEYRVDTRLLAEHDWPAPREAGFVAEGVVSLVGRALFVTTDTQRESSVTFELPAPWRPYAPWDRSGGGSTFHVRSAGRLRENLVVFSRVAPSLAEAAGFRSMVVPIGSWRPLEPELRRVMRAHVRNFVEWMDFRGRESYLAVLLPLRDRGAESYRQSLALTFEEEPSRENEARWANLIGHELFHFWNGWLFHGAEYAPSQWFHEGFTEYAANVSTVAAGFLSEQAFREKLAEHIANYRRLTTSLENPGTKKGPPLYSGGALVAFVCDATIRDATNGERGLGDFLRALLRRLSGGERSYDREDLIAALNETAEHDWRSFLDSHVRGTTPLPLDEAFALVGLRLGDGPNGASVEPDPQASARAKRVWRGLVRGE